jgi:hydroxymethylpyrimidine/phosphomethylpyrimidine kinase
MYSSPYVLSVAGSDPSGGAGMQADIKTIMDMGCEAGAVATALTVQTGLGVSAVYPVDPEALARQLGAVFSDMPVRAVKIGMLRDAETVAAVAPFIAAWAERGVPVVLDPICVSSSGFPLLDGEGRGALLRELCPYVSLVTPNLRELMLLAGREPSDDPGAWEDAAEALLRACGVPALLLTGGHLPGDGAFVADYLFRPGTCVSFARKAVPGGESVRGTGCALSAAAACLLAWGKGTEEAAAGAGLYVREAIRRAYAAGRGRRMLGRGGG